MRHALLMLVVLALLTVPLMRIDSSVQAVSSSALATFSGALSAGEGFTHPWQLDGDVPEPGFLLRYSITGGADPFDVVNVYLEETSDAWELLMGEGWAYCSPISPPPCTLDPGFYNVAVEADPLATGPLTYEISFYLTPQPPAEFSGRIPAGSDLRLSSFGVIFPSATTGQLVIGASSGAYEFFIDGESKGVVSSSTELAVEFSEGFHLLEVDSQFEGVGQDVVWSVRVPPRLDVSIVNTCPILNPEAGQSLCITGAETTASDGGNPQVSYLWTASGGSLNSTTGQWVEWTAPQGVAAFTLSVRASAPGYFSDTDSLVVEVVPEFPSAVVPLLMVIGMALMMFAPRRQRPRAALP